VALKVSRLLRAHFRRVLLHRAEYAMEEMYHVECKTILVQVSTDPEITRSLRLPYIETIGT
jgi:hypothetical protein